LQLWILCSTYRIGLHLGSANEYLASFIKQLSASIMLAYYFRLLNLRQVALFSIIDRWLHFFIKRKTVKIMYCKLAKQSSFGFKLFFSWSNVLILIFSLLRFYQNRSSITWFVIKRCKLYQLSKLILYFLRPEKIGALDFKNDNIPSIFPKLINW